MAICHLPPNDYLPTTLGRARFWSVTRTDKGYSIVLPEENVPPGWQAETGWRGLKVQGPLDLDLTGVLASITTPLAEAKVSIFAISTYDTDYILVREKDLEKAKQVLMASGHTLL
ncbi:MAG: ACT domain-containing protein [Calditrichaeota bacterium]|nr:ACT domain-containing protein [Calditrichota bacterium]